MDIDIDSLVPLPLSTSIVWKYFGFLSISGEIVDRNYVYCKRCKMRIKYSNNTSNLYKHFATHHSSDYEQLYSLRKIRTGPEIQDVTSKRCKLSNSNDSSDLNANILEAAHIKLDMVDPEPHFLNTCPNEDSTVGLTCNGITQNDCTNIGNTKNIAKSDIPILQSTNSNNRFMNSSNYASSNQTPNYQRKSTPINSVHLHNTEMPSTSINNNVPPTHFNYHNHGISESINYQNCNSLRKTPENSFKSTQWPIYCQNNNSPNSGVILDVLGALATVRRYCEANNLDLSLLQQLEKQIAVSELHRLSQ